MLFNSFDYIYLFLPFVLAGFYALTILKSMRFAWVFFTLMSCIFYASYNVKYFILLLGSIYANYAFSRMIGLRKDEKSRKNILTLGIIFNISLLIYFKYTSFILGNIEYFFPFLAARGRVVLPLAISFYTFQQIAYLADTAQGKCQDYGFGQYLLFVMFFPQLIAGPIVHHRSMIAQFLDPHRMRFCARNVYLGLIFFAIGLFKKTLSDNLAGPVDTYFSIAYNLSFWQAWAAMLGYALQLYFDFSGYCDMAIGAAKMLNIDLPFNFNSPYKSVNIRDFWARWHITLSQWLRDYVYIPLGGNRAGTLRTYSNLWMVFFLGGLWHGANWTFVLWGILHGTACVLHRIWNSLGARLNVFFGQMLTLLFVAVAWIFFRADTIDKGFAVLGSLINFRTFSPVESSQLLYLGLIVLLGILCFTWPNTQQIVQRIARWHENDRRHSLVCMLLGTLFGLYVFWSRNLPQVDFIYSNF